MDTGIKSIEWLGDRVRLIDQTRLPHRLIYLEITDYRDVAKAIKRLQVRGAPAIGVAAAYGAALGAMAIVARKHTDFLKKYRKVAATIAATRPTARNLFVALERLERVAEAATSVVNVKKAIIAEATNIHSEEIEATRELSDCGANLISDGATVLTHCNTGPLATTGYGTALGVIIRSFEQGKKVRVYADETRPLCQGARLTTWELQQAGVPVMLITDSMAGYFLSRGEIDSVIVGADRIATNGDTANKIGTYSLAVLAKENGVPFYVAAPTSTIDLSLKTGQDIPIEERDEKEVTRLQGVRTAPVGTRAANPAFDVTPHRYITAIITERGIVQAPYGRALKEIINRK